MSLSEEERPSLTAEDSDDSGVHLKQSRMSDCDPDSDGRTQGCVEMDFSQKIHKSCSLSDQMTIEGCLLWAKIRGFSYWPGITTVDPYEGVTSKVIESSKRTKTHIHFLAYDNLRAWVNESDVLSYEGYEKFKELAYKFPKRKKDFEPGKKFRNIFERAVKEAEAVMCIPVALRLEKLGFVYIPTNIDGATRNVLAKKKKSRRRSSKTSESENISSKFPLYQTVSRNDHQNIQGRQLPRRNPSHLIDTKSKDIYEFVDDETNASDSDLLSDYENTCDNTKDNLPKLGTLIWGHMAGFPYWPCFVTRSSDGDYIREAKNKISVHVQFFNWNDESGWVTKTMPWCSVAEFRRFAKEAIKEDVSCSMDWSPVGKMLHKWKNAALQAESTVHLSRKERHKRFLVKIKKNIVMNRRIINNGFRVSDDHININASKSPISKFKTPPPPIVTTSTRLPPGWIIRCYKEEDYGKESRTEYQSPDGAVFLKIENAISYLFQQNNSGIRKRSYSTPGGCIASDYSSLSCLSPSPACKKRRLDAGWFIYESDQHRYSSTLLRPQINYLDLDDSVQYIQDTSLPRGWSVKRIRMGRNPEVQSSYLSPECKTYSKVPQEWPSRREFFSKAAAASYLEGMGHPAVELEHVIVTGMIQCLSRKDHFLKVDDYLDYRLSETPELRKIVDPTFVKVTPLPKDIYRHSSVLVEEKDGKFQLKDVNSVPLSLNGN